MFCKYCGKQLADNAIFCSQCGKKLDTKASEVAKTEKELTPASFTPVQTNTPKKEYEPTISTKSRPIAALLAFFLGELGAHRFYVGKTGSAIVQLVLGLSFVISLFAMAVDFYEAGIFFLLLGIGWCCWTLVDFFMILAGTFTDKDNLILKNWDF